MVPAGTGARDGSPQPARLRFRAGPTGPVEWAPSGAGVPVRHVEQGRDVPVSVTGRQCPPAGRPRGPMAVSTRPVAPERPRAAIRESGLLPAVHGGPVHRGDPAAPGTADPVRPASATRWDSRPTTSRCPGRAG